MWINIWYYVCVCACVCLYVCVCVCVYQCSSSLYDTNLYHGLLHLLWLIYWTSLYLPSLMVYVIVCRTCLSAHSLASLLFSLYASLAVAVSSSRCDWLQKVSTLFFLFSPDLHLSHDCYFSNQVSWYYMLLAYSSLVVYVIVCQTPYLLTRLLHSSPPFIYVSLAVAVSPFRCDWLQWVSTILPFLPLCAYI